MVPQMLRWARRPFRRRPARTRLERELGLYPRVIMPAISYGEAPDVLARYVEQRLGTVRGAPVSPPLDKPKVTQRHHQTPYLCVAFPPQADGIGSVCIWASHAAATVCLSTRGSIAASIPTMRPIGPRRPTCTYLVAGPPAPPGTPGPPGPSDLPAISSPQES